MQSHEIALRLRGELEEVARDAGARIAIVEVPPGPPVLVHHHRRGVRRTADALRATARGGAGTVAARLRARAAGLRRRQHGRSRFPSGSCSPPIRRRRRSRASPRKTWPGRSRSPSRDLDASRLHDLRRGESAPRSAASAAGPTLRRRVPVGSDREGPARDREDPRGVGHCATRRFRWCGSASWGASTFQPAEKAIYHKNLRPVATSMPSRSGRAPAEAIIDVAADLRPSRRSRRETAASPTEPAPARRTHLPHERRRHAVVAATGHRGASGTARASGRSRSTSSATSASPSPPRSLGIYAPARLPDRELRDAAAADDLDPADADRNPAGVLAAEPADGRRGRTASRTRSSSPRRR